MARGAALSIEQHTATGGAAVLAVEGELELATAGRRTREAEGACGGGPRGSCSTCAPCGSSTPAAPAR